MRNSDCGRPYLYNIRVFELCRKFFADKRSVCWGEGGDFFENAS